MKIHQLAIGTGIAAALLGVAVELPVHGEPGAEHSHDGMAQDGASQHEMNHDGMAGDEMDAMSHDEMSHDGSHAHKQLEVSADLPPPSVELAVYEDVVNGWNLEVQLANFEFAPSTVNEPGPQNEGHAHLYINGEKVTRLYSNWYHLPELSPGDNEIMVTLNTNVHEDLTVNGEIISATTVVSVTE